MEMQLFLIYRGHFSWHDVDTMPIYELIWNYDTLVKWKTEEQEAYKEQSDNSPAALFNSEALDDMLD